MTEEKHVRLFIVGSCVTRDILALAKANNLELVDYFARSSFASLAGPPHEDEAGIGKITSAFQRKVVRRDHDKSLFATLRHSDFDMIVVDFIDERFRLLQTASGSVATLSNEYVSCRTQAEGDTVHEYDSRHKRKLWNVGWKKFLDTLSETGNIHKLVVNRVYWDPDYKLDRPGHAYIKKMNSELDWYYDQVSSSLQSVNWLTHPAEHLASDLDHKWKAAPYHYVQAYYDQSMEDLARQAAQSNDLPARPSMWSKVLNRIARARP